VTFCVLALSFSSGYCAPNSRSWSRVWGVTPLGLLAHFDSNLWLLHSSCAFQGRWGPHFDYAVVFFATCLIELPFYWWVFRSWPRADRVSLNLVFNFATHPLVFFGFPCFFGDYLVAVLSGEFFALFTETLLAVILLGTTGKKISIVRSLGIAVANLVSWQLGAWI
jgi:hypothetical protein